MLHLDLTPEEMTILIETLQGSITDLRMEVADTDNADYRDMLKSRERVLKHVLAALKAAQPVGPA
jgi:hypothetical protein